MGTTTYTYDPASNLATATYPNGLQSTYSYDQLNRLSSASTAVSSYQYSRDNNGNILTATEGSGRSATYTYDGIDELTSETVANDPAKDNGAISYVLDPVGNRDSDTSSLAPIDSSSTGFNADDQPQTESYDANGDTIATGGNTFAYNSWLKLVSMNGGQVTLAYNGLGQLVSKSTSSGTTQYLIDDLSPTGYPQVVEELQGGQVTRTYTYGLERISQLQPVTTNGNNTWTPSFYVYDGRGTVRMLANAAGAVTDTYAYDAFGNLLNQTGSTPNAYLYRGERWDQDLGLYYLRARWYNPATGRFMTRDPYAGSIWDPASLHRYNYARANPVNYIDPSGRADLTEYEFALVDVLPTIGEVAFVGQQVACDYSVMASILDIIFDAPYANGEQMQLASIQLDKSLGKCGVKATWQGNLLNVGIGVAAALATEGFSRLLGDAAEGAAEPWLAAERAPNIVYRGLSASDAESLEAGQGLVAKAPDGEWTAAEHVANAGPGAGGAAANSPWISTSKILDVAQAYDSGNGVVAIDLSKVDSLQVEVWQTAPNVSGAEGLAFQRSYWGQEVTVYQTIPQSAVVGPVPTEP